MTRRTRDWRKAILCTRFRAIWVAAQPAQFGRNLGGFSRSLRNLWILAQFAPAQRMAFAGRNPSRRMQVATPATPAVQEFVQLVPSTFAGFLFGGVRERAIVDRFLATFTEYN